MARKKMSEPESEITAEDAETEAGPAERETPEAVDEPAVTLEEPFEVPEQQPENVAGSPETKEDSKAELPPEPVNAPPERRRGGFFAPFAGGILAAGLGAGAVVYFDLTRRFVPDDSEAVAALGAAQKTQDAALSALKQQIATLSEAKPAAVETDPALLTSLDEARAALEEIQTRLSALQARSEEVETRLSALEKRPVEGGAASASAIEAISREMDELRAKLAEQQTAGTAAQASIDAAAAAAAEKIAAAEAEAARLKAEAETAARAARARAALSHLRAAVDAGATADEAVTELMASGADVPTGLADQIRSAPTPSTLIATFAPAARDALALSRVAVSGDGYLDKTSAFLKSQLGMRSLAPKAGEDPDAVLSRAEAALKVADLEGTIAELGGLPPEGQARMAEWIASAQRRIDLEAAITDLATKLGASE